MNLALPKNLEYITKTNSQTSYIQMPTAEWEAFVASVEKQLQKEKLKAGIKEAFAEIKDIRAGKVKEVTLKELLDSL